MPFAKQLILALGAALAVSALLAGSAFASTTQITIVEENNGLNSNPMATLEKLKESGVTMVKYSITWQYVTPHATAAHAPAGANSPRFYTSQFGQLAQIDQDANKVGVKLGFLISSPVPRWAQTSAAGCSAYAITNDVCHPSASDFAVFVTALGDYFNGSVSGVPAVRWWSIWNEPNYGVNLAPEMGASADYAGADQYRRLLGAAWTALKTTGHTTPTDTILFGDLAPRGISAPTGSNDVGYKPVQFLASLYCVTTTGRRLKGRTAGANGCPRTAAAFRAANPALFDASGVADHPYGQGLTPATKTTDCTVGGYATFCIAGAKGPADPLWTDLASISNLENGLDRDVRAEGGSKTFPIWNTEYGYWTTPPGSNACQSATQANCDLSPADAAVYLNEAEYISYRNPRIVSFDQYQLYQPSAGAWTDGLLNADGTVGPDYDAWEVPLWLPVATLRQPGAVTVWGGAKRAYHADTSSPVKPQIAIQFMGANGTWSTVKTLPASTSAPGAYFQTTVNVSESGSIRLVYRVGTVSVDSRSQALTVG